MRSIAPRDDVGANGDYRPAAVQCTHYWRLEFVQGVEIQCRVCEALLADQALKPMDGPSETKFIGAEESNQSDDDQIKGDDIVQQPGDDKNENPGDQRYQGSKSQGDIHGAILSSGKVMDDGLGFSLSLTMRRIVFTPKTMSALYGPARNGVIGETTIAVTIDG